MAKPKAKVIKAEPDEWESSLPERVESAAVVDVEEEQAYSAHRMQQAGHDWATIAEAVGYANAKTAEVRVRHYLQKAALEVNHERRMEALALTLGRSDRLLAAYWESALGGEVRHAEFVLKVLAYQAGLQKLDELTAVAGGTSKTIVITGSTEDYVGALQKFGQEDQ